MIRFFILVFLCLIPLGSIHSDPILVTNNVEQSELPPAFRATNDLGAHQFPSGISLEGLSTLNISGSQQFTEKQLGKMLEKLPKSVVTVDLRQESHGFINGQGLYWYEPYNWSNRGLTDKQVMTRETSQLDALKKMPTVNLFDYHYKTLEEETKDTPDVFTLIPNIPVKSVKSEKQVMAEKGQPYFRIYVPDDLKPSDANVDQFLDIWKKFPANQWFHFHCRDGRGRTTTFMVLADILRNGKKVTLNDIIERQAAMGPKDLNKLPPEANYKYPYALERLKFIQAFYDYVKENPTLNITWSDWIKKHPVK